MTSSETSFLTLTFWILQGRIPNVAIECVMHLRKRFPGVKISVEAENPTREGLEEIAVSADVVFYSKSWAMVR